MEVSEMEMKQVYEALEKVENGADLIAAIKGEINTLNNEAKKHRTAGEQSATKLKSILEAVGLDDGDDVVDKAKGLKTTLDQFAQGGKKPDEVAKQITDLTAQVGKVTKQLAEMTETAKAEKTKRLDGMKMAKAVELLTKGNAASPQNMAKLLEGSIVVKDDESLAYTGCDGKEISLEDGVNGWLKENSWAVRPMVQAVAAAMAVAAVLMIRSSVALILNDEREEFLLWLLTMQTSTAQKLMSASRLAL